MVLAKEKIDLRGFERRPGEVLLRQDILGHRLIDVTDVELVPAYDVELDDTGAGWVLARLDTRQPARMFALAGLLLPSASVFRLLLCNDREVLGPWINPRWQRTAINSEAKLLMLTHAFEVWKCIRVELKTDANNKVSQKAIQRLGLVRIPRGRIKHVEKKFGVFRFA